MHLDEAHRFLASPSITRLPSGRLLLLYEKCAPLLSIVGASSVKGHTTAVQSADEDADRQKQASFQDLTRRVEHESCLCIFCGVKEMPCMP